MTRSQRLVILATVVVYGLIHGLTGHTGFATDNKVLPLPVMELRDALLTAAKTGNLEEFKAATDVSSTKPDLGGDQNLDIQAALKAASGDADGREALAALSEVLELAPATLPLGRDLENNLVYVWPYLSSKPLDTLSASEVIDLYRLVPAAKVIEMRHKRRWLWWQIEIAADGRLLSLKKHN